MCSYKAVDTFTWAMAVAPQAATTFHLSVTPSLPEIWAQLGSEPPKMHIGVSLTETQERPFAKQMCSKAIQFLYGKQELFTVIVSY